MGGENAAFARNYVPVGFLTDLEDDAVDAVRDPAGNVQDDNVQGFTPEMFFQALNRSRSVRDFGNQLRAQSLGLTPTSEADFNDLLDIYDVFN